MIFDTNVLIYLSKYIIKPEEIINEQSSISIITKIEALGYAFERREEYDLISNICSALSIIAITDSVAEETIRLRSKYKIKLPDAIIYATAAVENLPLLTNNISDFKMLDGNVKLINPFSL
ncbi:type II toxin-antitoxin system VapC family toxin [Mucilaginibacter sp. RS28]|uniref:Type II toxin-antitoxin system VapC family toxin n=1 Tax=Mucilaginibacter straminoryzae TaxID=2932774 RepID=A0A9X2B7U1_9SPHI|nr:type II toxin-antitoxin system VapC family toxin [Mucilaginibacter straminoryzae]